MTTESQKAFEEWHDNLFDLSANTAVKSQYGYPENKHIQMRWQAWQASREHIIANLQSEEMVEKIAEAIYKSGMAYYNNKMPFVECHIGFQNTFRESAKQVIASLLEVI